MAPFSTGRRKKHNEWDAILESQLPQPIYFCLKEFLCSQALAQQGRCVFTDGGFDNIIF